MKKIILLQALLLLIASSVYAAPTNPLVLKPVLGQDARATVEKAFGGKGSIDSADECSKDARFEHLKIEKDAFLNQAVLRFDLNGQGGKAENVIDKDCNIDGGNPARAREEIKQKSGDSNVLKNGNTGNLIEILMIPQTTQLSTSFTHFHIWQLKPREISKKRPANYLGNDEMYSNATNPVLRLSLQQKIVESKTLYETTTDGAIKIDATTKKPVLKKVMFEELQLNYQDDDGIFKMLGFAPLESIRGKWLKITANFKIANDGFVNFKVESLDKNQKVQEIVFDVQHKNIDLWNENAGWLELYNKTGLYFGRTANEDSGDFESVPNQTLFLNYLKIWKD
jgi:hypothetical protein